MPRRKPKPTLNLALPAVVPAVAFSTKVRHIVAISWVTRDLVIPMPNMAALGLVEVVEEEVAAEAAGTAVMLKQIVPYQMVSIARAQIVTNVPAATLLAVVMTLAPTPASQVPLLALGTLSVQPVRFVVVAVAPVRGKVARPRTLVAGLVRLGGLAARNTQKSPKVNVPRTTGGIKIGSSATRIVVHLLSVAAALRGSLCVAVARLGHSIALMAFTQMTVIKYALVPDYPQHHHPNRLLHPAVLSPASQLFVFAKTAPGLTG